jgi:UDP-N-acetylglucosamine 2-epimerase (non-hydrolysing)
MKSCLRNILLRTMRPGCMTNLRDCSVLSKLGVIVGTRPEAIKLVPVYLELKKRFGQVDLVSTGQHFSMLEQIFNFFEVRPDVSLDVMRPNQTLAGLTSQLCERIQDCIEERGYDLIVVQGDTTTAMTASLIAFYNRIPVAHVEAGLRTHEKYSPFPEEMNRQIISRIADFHFAPTDKAFQALEAEGIKGRYMVGNTVIDSLLRCLDKIKAQEPKYAARFALVSSYRRLVLITGHRRENFGKGFDQICAAIRHLSEAYSDYLFYYPVHLNPNVKNTVEQLLGGLKNVVLDEPLPYDEVVYLMSRSFIILTDSGGIQEEGPTLNVPILVMRDTTERPEGIDNGCSVLVGTSREKITSEFHSLVADSARYQRMAQAINPYGHGDSSARIAQIILGARQ